MNRRHLSVGSATGRSVGGQLFNLNRYHAVPPGPVRPLTRVLPGGQPGVPPGPA